MAAATGTATVSQSMEEPAAAEQALVRKAGSVALHQRLQQDGVRSTLANQPIAVHVSLAPLFRWCGVLHRQLVLALAALSFLCFAFACEHTLARILGRRLCCNLGFAFGPAGAPQASSAARRCRFASRSAARASARSARSASAAFWPPPSGAVHV